MTQTVCAALCIVLMIMSSTVPAIAEIETLCDPVKDGVCDARGACGHGCVEKGIKLKYQLVKATCEMHLNPVECCCTFLTPPPGVVVTSGGVGAAVAVEDDIMHGTPLG
ncbi:uncharacterized protein [Zea mays]|uniref:uncharacterized protein isoform X2 n=1 Tax=Zea mays TaxID=4577 RepID=UPI0009AA5980|nr:uncharacterized protein LOC100279016 isoform X2 [Zea mays]|eukprot:XP_020407058.1 uncharacterized protein LOC100279016 isoform X2 [Zea mays]